MKGVYNEEQKKQEKVFFYYINIDRFYVSFYIL